MAGMVEWELLGAVWTEDEILGRYKLKYVNPEFQLLNGPIVGLIIIICQTASILLHWCGILVNRHSTCCKPLCPIIHDRQHPNFLMVNVQIIECGLVLEHRRSNQILYLQMLQLKIATLISEINAIEICTAR